MSEAIIENLFIKLKGTEMKESISIRSDKAGNYVFDNLKRKINHKHKTLIALILSEFKQHLDKLDPEKREISVKFLLRHISRELEVKNKCELVYPGDLARGIIDKKLVPSDQIMFRNA